MKGIKYFILIFAVLITELATSLYSKPETIVDNILLIPHAAYPPVIDGEMDEIWYNVSNTPASSYVEGTEPDNWLDLFTFFRLMWDEQYIYMFARIYDDVIDTHHSNSWERDGLEIYFDGDNSKNDESVGPRFSDMSHAYSFSLPERFINERKVILAGVDEHSMSDSIRDLIVQSDAEVYNFSVMWMNILVNHAGMKFSAVCKVNSKI